MKRLLPLLIFIFPFLHYSSAQTFRAGFYAGATATDIDGTDNVDNDNDFVHLGFTVGGTVSTKISRSTTLQMEIRFIQKGAEQRPAYDTIPNNTNNPTIGVNEYFDLTLDYVDVVIGVKHAIHFNLRNANTDRYGIEGGVSVGSLFHYSYTVQSITTPIDLVPLDVSPYIGIYYNVTPHFYLEGRYSNSVTTVIKHDARDTPDFYSLWYDSWDAGHNLAFTLTMGFVFGKSRWE